eukprot:scaffold3968_cov92-Isochrysis_galbana.AAC.2
MANTSLRGVRLERTPPFGGVRPRAPQEKRFFLCTDLYSYSYRRHRTDCVLYTLYTVAVDIGTTTVGTLKRGPPLRVRGDRGQPTGAPPPPLT